MNDIFEDSYLNDMNVSVDFQEQQELDHRASCHRCGNIRKSIVKCSVCPHVFCQKCCQKVITMDGEEAFIGGCPLCKDLCCCGSKKSPNCTREFHCYKKCLRSRILSPRSGAVSPRVRAVLQTSRSNSQESLQNHCNTHPELPLQDSDSEDNHEKLGNPADTDKEGGISKKAHTVTPALKRGRLHPPVDLAPINTSIQEDFASPIAVSATQPKTKGAFHTSADTPTKRLKTVAFTTEEKGLGKETVEPAPGSEDKSPTRNPSQRVTQSVQPPFNTGYHTPIIPSIPPIFAPQSLTPATSPFFLQSSLPCTARLPPIGILLQNENANPYFGLIPHALHCEIQKMSFPAIDAIMTRQRSTGDPGLGYGMTFRDAASKLPSSRNNPVGNDKTTVSHPQSTIAGVSTGVVTPPNVGIPSIPPHFGYVSTPNIDRACQYLAQHHNRLTSAGNKASAHPTAPTAHSVCTPAPAAVPVKSQSESQEPLLTPVSGLFCTPIATECNNSAFATQRSDQEGGSGTSYDWTGDSISTLHHLGVDVLTPAGLPQCTPMTVEPAAVAVEEYTYPAFVNYTA